MINKVTLIGNLGRDPEIKHLESGTAVARFSVATNENFKDKSGNWQTLTEWHEIVAWRALAEKAEKDLKKGSLVYIEGRLRTRKFTNDQGVDKMITEVEALQIKSLDKREKTSLPDSDSSHLPTSTAGQSQEDQNSPGVDHSMDKDLPF